MKPGNPLEPQTRAVVVNDDVTQINLFTALLHKDGIEVISFLDAEAALLAMVQNDPPDLIITDLYMPGLDGWRFCRLLRSPEYQAFNQIPILIISATFSGDEAASITADLGADAFLTSPIDAGQFISHVHILLGGERSHQQLRVLIVEDSKTLQGILKKAFDAHGCRTETALTLKAAVAAFGKSPWDVAVIDYHLPDGDGDDLLLKFRAQQRDCVCIMMTTDPAPELALSWMKKGAAAYLRKPFAPEYLIEMCVKTRRERALLRVQDLLEMRTQELQKSEERYRSLVENASEMVFRTDVNGYFTFVNTAMLCISGYEEKEIIGRQYTILLCPEKREEALRFFGQQLVKGIANTYSEYPVLTKDGQEFWVGQNAHLVVEGGKVSGFQIVARDITKRRKAEDALRESEEKYRIILESIEEGYYEVDLAGNFTFFNDSLCRIIGYPKEEIMGMNNRQYTDKEHQKKLFKMFNKVYRTGQSTKEFDWQITRKDGTKRYIEVSVSLQKNSSGNPIGFHGIAHDITERKRMEEKLLDSEKRYRELSIIDDLTQLYNSRYFYHQLKTEIDRAIRYGKQPLSLLLLDLDNFKEFNDNYGHVEGDQVLSRLGQLIKKCLRESDLAYRYGGEEFTILLPMTTSRDGIVTAERIRTELKKEIFSPVPEKKVCMTTSIGIAQYRIGEDMKAFVARADQLMYQAKNDGKDRVCCE